MTFVENPKEENELPLDKNLKQKLEEWKQDFMLLLYTFFGYQLTILLFFL